MRDGVSCKIPTNLIYQFGSAIKGEVHIVGLIAAVAVLAYMIYMLLRPYKEATELTIK